MSVHAFLSLEYRTPLRIRLEINGKKEGTGEGLMRKRCKTSGPHNELWAQQLAMADTCCNRKKCKPSIYKPELALPLTFSTNLEKTRNPAYGCLTNPASSKQQTSNHTISQPATRSQQDQMQQQLRAHWPAGTPLCSHTIFSLQCHSQDLLANLSSAVAAHPPLGPRRKVLHRPSMLRDLRHPPSSSSRLRGGPGRRRRTSCSPCIRGSAFWVRAKQLDRRISVA